MKYIRFIVIALVVMSLIYLSLGWYQKSKEKEERNTGPSSSVQSQYETKKDTQGVVTVEVTPQISQGNRQWKFDVVFDTHAIELDQDPLQVAVLVDDQGNIFKPTAWDGPGPGGHHREGSLIFDAITPIPKYIELKVKDIGSILERSFKWNIQ